MREIIDREILLLYRGLFNKLITETSIFVNDAQALCAIFMFLFFAVRAYGMLVGDKDLKIMPLLRPFGLAFVLFLWPEFIGLMNVPGELIADKSKGILEDRIGEVDALQLLRRKKMAEVARRLIEDSAELEQWDDGEEDDWASWTGVDFGQIFDEIKGYYIIILSKLRWLVVETLEFIVITIFQVCSYFIFFLQIIFGAILIILGPFAFAFSTLPAFKDSYINWIARYFSVTLYLGLGYLVMSLSMLLITYALEKELLILEYVLQNEAAFFLFISSNDGSANFYLVSLLIGASTMLTIPILSTWIISTTGIGNAVSTAVKGGMVITRAVT